jgi:signal transduction histidine kinase
MVNKQEFEDILKRRNAELVFINNVQEKLFENRDIQQFVDYIGEGLKQILNPQYLQISMYNHEIKQESVVYFIENGRRKKPKINPFTQATKQLIQSKRLLIINEKNSESSGKPDRVETRELQEKSMIYAPMISGHDVAGSISLRHERNEVIYDTFDLKFITHLATAIGHSIQYLRSENELHRAHNDLNAAQEQLIQKEKLASLGQMSAGIAHEIKNPLNFVNNFSELSIEMIKEAREVLLSIMGDVKREKVSTKVTGQGETRDLVFDILADIETNLQKINEHGKRADSIVKSMLLHSKGGSGKPEPVNLNSLVREYVNLAFHGMRAGSEPMNVDIRLNMDENIGEVPLIAEDFSRIILNLCDNAFDAMREKQMRSVKPESGSGPEQKNFQQTQKYQPVLTVKTTGNHQSVSIDIEDNGPGIPEEFKDRILQPFFTTKQGTEGTGLGLSITNDIVRMHGGEMKIESEYGRGSLFRIIIPVNLNVE